MRPRLWPVCQKHSYVLRLWEILFHNVLDQHVFPSLSHCCTLKVIIKNLNHIWCFCAVYFFPFWEWLNVLWIHVFHNMILGCYILDHISVSENLKVRTIIFYHKYLEVCYKRRFSKVVSLNKLNTNKPVESHTLKYWLKCVIQSSINVPVSSELNDESEHFFGNLWCIPSLIHLLQNGETPAQLHFCSCKTLKPQLHNVA